ncbi:MAG: hypothetical protein QME05_04770 [Candidatus Margulisbacteria bacterium]|nr:hypothetical protein [Candidatus Margulisiibacteriota bacterium]
MAGLGNVTGAVRTVEAKAATALLDALSYSGDKIKDLINSIPTLKELGGLHSFVKRRVSLPTTSTATAEVISNPKPVPLKVPGQNSIEIGESNTIPKAGIEQTGSTLAVLAALTSAIPELRSAFRAFAVEQKAVQGASVA